MLVAAQRAAAQRAIDQQVDQVSRQAEDARAEGLLRQRQQVAYSQWLRERARLLSNQRWVGGYVVQVQGNVYTQVGYPGQLR